MRKTAILTIIEGTVKTGFIITFSIQEENGDFLLSVKANLPPNVEIEQFYKAWTKNYSLFYDATSCRIQAKKTGNLSRNVSLLEPLAEQELKLKTSLIFWLDSNKFRPIKEAILSNFNYDDEIKFIIQTENIFLRKLPWSEYKLFENYPKLAIVFSKSKTRVIHPKDRHKDKDKDKKQVKILAILGDSFELKVKEDLKQLKTKLPDADIFEIINPTREKLTDRLWEQNWDLFFFSGHSSLDMDRDKAWFELQPNLDDQIIVYFTIFLLARDKKYQLIFFFLDFYYPTEYITIKDLKEGLKTAINNGLQLAIFNSCDGLGLAKQLEELQLSATVVMTEKIPDELSPKLLQYFLNFFAKEGNTLELSIRRTRERLSDLKKKYPSASWLPVVCESLKTESLTLHKLGGLPACPYRGLFTFTEEDSELFFGRNKFIEQLVTAVQSQSLVTVMGASGSGKSSVVLAGLVPYLKRQAKEVQKEIKIAIFTPGHHPFDALAGAVISLQNSTENNQQILEKLNFFTQLQQDNQALAKNLEKIILDSSVNQIVLVIDQFEELYTFAPQAQIKPFLDSLLTAIEQLDFLRVVITLREDFLGKALETFGETLQKYKPEFLLKMNREEIEKAIASPARKRGVTIDKQLTESLINSVVNEPGYLPLLEFTLTQLWKLQNDGRITYEIYQKFGTLEKSLGEYAEIIYLQRTKDDRKRIEQIFIQLIYFGEQQINSQSNDNNHQVEPSNLAHQQDTRTIATKEQLGDKNWELISYLVAARLVVTGYNENTGEETVEIIHEALITHWKRLQKWISNNRYFRSKEQIIGQKRKKWLNKHQCSDEALLQGVDLLEAEAWLQKYSDKVKQDDKKFIQKSIDFEDGKKQEKEHLDKLVLQRTIYALSGISIAALMAFLIIFIQFKQLEKQRINGLNQQVDSRNSSSQSLLLLNKNFDALRESFKAANLAHNNSNITHHNYVNTAITLQSILYRVRLMSVWEKHQNIVLSVDISPNGQLIASGSRDNTVKIWYLDGTLLTNITGHKGSVNYVDFSPNGQLVASASNDKTIKVWHNNGTLITTLKGHQGRVLSVKFSPDGQYLISGGDDSTLRIWSINGQLLRTLDSHKNWVFDVSFSPPILTAQREKNELLIASASWDKTVKIWNLKGKLLTTLEGHTDQVDSVVFSRDGKLIITGSADNTIKIWQPDGTLIRTIETVPNLENLSQKEKDANIVYSVSLSPDGKIIASASKNGKIQLWNLQGELLETLIGHTNSVNSVSFTPNGKVLVSASGDSTVRLWDLSPRPFLNHNGTIVDLDFILDGKEIVTISNVSQNETDKKKVIRLWDLQKQQFSEFANQEKYRRVSVSPDGTKIVTTNDDKTVQIWNKKGILLKTLTEHTERVFDVNFSPDSKLFATTSYDKTVKIWREDGTLINTLTGHSDRVLAVSFSPDGKRIATGGGDRTIKLWTTEGKFLTTLVGHNDWILDIKFSSDGQLIATASHDQTIKIWNLQGELIKTLKGHTNTVNSIDFSSDGELIVSGSEDNTIKLWSREGDLLTTVNQHQGGVRKVAFSPDGKSIVSGGGDGIIILWSLDLGTLIEQGCGLIGDYLRTNSNVKEEERMLCEVK
ncbi:WD40 repeat domain-containing protein [Okeania sp. SIO2B3]|uniref:WD40 repeat domain-containing protein n=1 Tax=Okeania sp. SIO2B3 TaxID=2607784 RepID=UPI0013BEB66F|nr:WD40 repeat domain-containing protein [Okeania sp. SIO2B3]NET45442.1 hypothetical protein [Okeania sp. SIO2B3]